MKTTHQASVRCDAKKEAVPRLGERVAAYRKKQRLTQKDLADLCEVKPITIQRAEASDPSGPLRVVLESWLEGRLDLGGERRSQELSMLSLTLPELVEVVKRAEAEGVPVMDWIAGAIRRQLEAGS